MEAPRMPAFRRDGSVLESFPQTTRRPPLLSGTCRLAEWYKLHQSFDPNCTLCLNDLSRFISSSRGCFRFCAFSGNMNRIVLVLEVLVVVQKAAMGRDVEDENENEEEDEWNGSWTAGQ